MTRIPKDLPEPAPQRGSGPFLKIAPPLSIPLRHFALASTAFLLFSAGLCFGADRLVGFGFEAKFALGLVHLLTLGWVAQTVLGAWTQMISVHGETPLASIGTMKASWWLIAMGLVAFVGMLWSGSDHYWIAAALVYVGVLGELAVLGVTHARAVRHDWTWTHFTAAMGWLSVLGLIGVLMSIDRHRGTIFRDPEGGLIAHVHMALVGFVTTTVFGAGYRLFPWISMHQMRSKLAGRLAFVLLQVGLTGLTIDALFFGRRLMPFWALLLAAAYLLYFSQLRPMLTGGAILDPSLALVLLGVAGGALWVALGVGLACGWIADEPSARAAYVYAALIGFFAPIILSQTHKIVPFLVWLHVYSPRQHTPPVRIPKIDDLTNRSLAWGESFSLAAAVPLGTAGLWLERGDLVRLAGICMFTTAACYARNMGISLRHIVHPDDRWTLPASL